MAGAIAALDWTALTAAVNEIKSPSQFLRKLLYSNEDPQHTELIEVSVMTGNRETAPFVKKNAGAFLVGGIGEQFQNIEAPNIRIKRVLEASNLMTKRRAGSVVMPGKSEMMSAIDAYIARQTQRMADICTNAEEYLCALSLTGTISYAVDPLESFTITYPKPAGNTVTLAGAALWSASTSTPQTDFYNAKKLMSDEVGLNPTDCIMSNTAALAFMTNVQVIATLDKLNVSAGGLSFANQFTDDGAIFLGTFCGIRCWSYPREVIVNGSSTKLIRNNYVEFVHAGSAAEFTMYFGAIFDMDALEEDAFVGRRFSKSWKEKDPSAQILLTCSRPLPVPRRPGAIVSYSVL